LDSRRAFGAHGRRRRSGFDPLGAKGRVELAQLLAGEHRMGLLRVHAMLHDVPNRVLKKLEAEQPIDDTLGLVSRLLISVTEVSPLAHGERSAGGRM